MMNSIQKINIQIKGDTCRLDKQAKQIAWIDADCKGIDTVASDNHSF